MRLFWSLLKFTVICTALIALTMWFAGQPGSLRFSWRGVEVETSTAFFFFALFVLCLLVWKAGKLFFWVKYSNARRREKRRRLKEAHGLTLLTASFNALAAQDLRQAAKAQVNAAKRLGNLPLVTWLGAQIAEQQSHTEAATKAYLSLTNEPYAANLGWRGVMELQQRHGSVVQQQALLATALKDKNIARQSYVHEVRLSAAARAGKWEDAREAMAAATSARALPRSRLRHIEQVILMERGQSLVTTQPHQAKLLLEAAYKMAPDFTPAALAYIDALIEEGSAPLAGKVIATAWMIAPQAALFERFERLYANETALARLQRFERIAQKHKDDAQTQLALGELSMASELYVKARAHIDRAQALAPSSRGYHLLADLALAESGDAHKAHNYARRAQDVAAQPHYSCTSCHSDYTDWQALCPSCGAFATLEKKD